MNKIKQVISALIIVISMLIISGCNGSSTESTDEAIDDGSRTRLGIGMDTALFLDGAVIEPITTEACTLSGGTQTSCYRITIAGQPTAAQIGPFCPPSINSDASEGGIWFDGSGEVYDIDGEFILNLENLYGSDWQLYDPITGAVNVTNTQQACEAAARPNVDPAYQNYCVECSLDYLGGAVSQTFLIPVEPIHQANPSQIRTDLGITLNGVVFAPAAPVQAILSNNTIAAFDDCGGHINPFEGYHYHAATGCSETSIEIDGHASILGYALDGYGIYAMLNGLGEEDFDLDECRGHNDDTRGYHYHVASAGENMFIGCYAGEQGSIE